MDLNAKHEFDQMIYEIAINSGTPKQRAQRGAKGLMFLEVGDVPGRLADDLKSLKESYDALASMGEEEVRQFITRIINFRDQLYFHGEDTPTKM
jgi:hypothetical protein